MKRLRKLLALGLAFIMTFQPVITAFAETGGETLRYEDAAEAEESSSYAEEASDIVGEEAGIDEVAEIIGSENDAGEAAEEKEEKEPGRLEGNPDEETHWIRINGFDRVFGSGDFSHIASGQNRQSQSEQKCHCTSFVPISCCCSG